MARQVPALFFLLLLVGLTSCGERSKENSSAMRTEMNSRKIKRVTASDISEAAMYTGTRLSAKIDSAMQAGMVKAGESSCRPLFAYFADSLGNLAGAAFNRWDKDGECLGPDQVTERSILEAFNASIAAGTIPGANIQEMSDTAILYNSPVLVQSSCLQCHGESKNMQVQSGPEKIIPGNISNLKTGMVIGFYSIYMPKSGIIRRMPLK